MEIINLFGASELILDGNIQKTLFHGKVFRLIFQDILTCKLLMYEIVEIVKSGVAVNIEEASVTGIRDQFQVCGINA